MDKDKVREKIQGLVKRFEMVMKTSSNPQQQKRASVHIAKMNKDLEKLNKGDFSEEDGKKYFQFDVPKRISDDENSGSFTGKYEILHTVPILQASKFCSIPEVNAIYSYLAYFENEFWGGISDFHLKLDFNHSQKRDIFYHNLNVLKISFKNYLDILEDLENTTNTLEYTENLKKMRSKYYMELLIKVGEFISQLYQFITSIILDYESEGNIILNPHEVLNFDKIQGERDLEGLTVLQALKKLQQFLSEVAEYLSLPEIKKK